MSSGFELYPRWVTLTLVECFLYMFISSKLLLDGLLGEAIKHNTRFTSTYCLGSTRIKHRSMSYSAVVIRPNYKCMNSYKVP